MVHLNAFIDINNVGGRNIANACPFTWPLGSKFIICRLGGALLSVSDLESQSKSREQTHIEGFFNRIGFDMRVFFKSGV